MRKGSGGGLLFPQLNHLPPGEISAGAYGVEVIAGGDAFSAGAGDVGVEGVVELAGFHAPFVFGGVEVGVAWGDGSGHYYGGLEIDLVRKE